MKKDVDLIEIIEAGKIMDLSPAEAINDFILHAPNYLPFDKIDESILCSMCQKQDNDNKKYIGFKP